MIDEGESVSVQREKVIRKKKEAKVRKWRLSLIEVSQTQIG